MNWKLILSLSVFGLAMGIGTVFVIPSNIEPIFWLMIFLICAYIIARMQPEKHFLHGLLVSMVNSVWVTGAHVLLFEQYAANHPQEMEMMQSMPLPTHPRVMMLILGPAIGVVSGLVLGLFALIASKLVKPDSETGAAREAF
jgi:hypothetical protein